MDKCLEQLLQHATLAEQPTAWPPTTFLHYRALSLLLSAEAIDSQLSASQRRNAQILLEHFSRKCLECKQQNAGPDSSLLHSSAHRTRMTDNINAKVDKVLEKKRTRNNFSSRLEIESVQNPATEARPKLGLPNLMHLLYPAEYDILPSPETLQILIDQSELNAAITAAESIPTPRTVPVKSKEGLKVEEKKDTKMPRANGADGSKPAMQNGDDRKHFKYGSCQDKGWDDSTEQTLNRSGDFVADHSKKRQREMDSQGPLPPTSSFMTAREKLIIEENTNKQKGQRTLQSGGPFNNGLGGSSNGSAGPSVGVLKQGATVGSVKRFKFKAPLKQSGNTDKEETTSSKTTCDQEQVDERLKNIDPKMVETIKNEIMDNCPKMTWDDISGLAHAKHTLKEAVIWPMMRPDLFTGLRRPPKGLLLFGPPGTGKTLIGKCIASQSNCTFFSISSSSLTSKWVGDGEKMVRALFAVASCHQPAVIFMDEIDSLLSQRSDGEIDASRRIKTEFLVQFDGVATGGDDRILLVGATNRPQEIDEAARRRFVKRLYIPLPEIDGRRGMIQNLLRGEDNDLCADQIEDICQRTEGYSGSDMSGLCREAAMGPVRSITDILDMGTDALRPINHQDFLNALSQVRASVSDKDLDMYVRWEEEYGSKAIGK